MILKEFISSSLAGGVSLILGIGLSYILESYTSPSKANLYGLVFASLMNFFLQKSSFHDHSKTNSKLIGKFYISEAIVLLLNHCLFILFLQGNQKGFFSSFRNLLPVKYQAPSSFNSIIRFIVSVLVFSLFAFPIRKYLIFTDPSTLPEESQHPVV